MNDRRGHRKLRLTSKKHFKPKPKRIRNSIPTRLSPELEQTDYQISLPLEAYVNAPVNCLNSLLNRLKNCGTIPSGWMNEVRNETLSVYEVDFSDSGPNLILRKMICLVSEGIWHFSY